MKTASSIETFWSEYQASLPKVPGEKCHPIPEAWSFGNDERLANALAHLVLLGEKTATCSRHREEHIPKVGELSILLDGSGRPLCVVETLEATTQRFCDVDTAFAAAEGEGDLSLEHWRTAHWNFFREEGKTEGYEVSEEMPLVCERFRVVFVPPDVLDTAPNT